MVAKLLISYYNKYVSKKDKLLKRLLDRPKDFTWSELLKLLESFGYNLSNAGKAGGSRVRFLHPKHPPIVLHKPHPSPELKRYQINDIIKMLKQEGFI